MHHPAHQIWLVPLLAVASLCPTILPARADEIKNPSGIVFPDFPNIVGGNIAKEGEFPFLVRLEINTEINTDVPGILCGGSLLTDTWVITAAHCLDGAVASGVSIRAGSNQKSSGGEVITASQLFMHPGYDSNPNTFDHDIALVKLSEAVTAPKTGAIDRLATNESTAMPEGSAVWVAGWGTTSSGGNTSEDLLKVSVNVSYPDACAANSSYSSLEITDNMICAGVPGGGQDACQGDSGGPLFRYDTNDDAWLAGIVSWGYGCAQANYPGVYTRVANYDAWISQTMAGSNTAGACVIDASSTRTGTQMQVNLNSGCTSASQETFQAAAAYWANFLYSPVKIEIDADFAPMTCTANSAVLGSAGPTYIEKDKPGLPETNTFYAIAHANALVGEDLRPTDAEISMNFNSNIGTTGCLENASWYFDDGAAPSTPAGTIDLYGTALHEIAHGLGFLSLLSSDGSQVEAGYSDAYTNRLYSESMGLLTNLTDSQRQSAMTSQTNLTWGGGAVDGLASTLIQGTTGGNVRMYAPNPYEGGSSVSHFDKSLTPNDVMEPVKTTRETTEDQMTRNLFRDIGWETIPDAPGIATVSAGSDYIDVTLTAPYHLGNTLLLNYTATCGGTSATGTGSTLRVSGLSPETQYNCSVTATTAVGESDASPVTQATTTPALPPGRATVTSVDTYADEATFQITITPSASSSNNVDDYWVECTAPNGTVVTGTSTTSSVTVSGLQESVSYSCEAYAENMVGQGGSTTVPNIIVDGVMPGLPIWLLYQATQSP